MGYHCRYLTLKCPGKSYFYNLPVNLRLFQNRNRFCKITDLNLKCENGDGMLYTQQPQGIDGPRCSLPTVGMVMVVWWYYLLASGLGLTSASWEYQKEKTVSNNY